MRNAPNFFLHHINTCATFGCAASLELAFSLTSSLDPSVILAEWSISVVFFSPCALQIKQCTNIHIILNRGSDWKFDVSLC